jgi:hypothetical protein
MIIAPLVCGVFVTGIYGSRDLKSFLNLKHLTPAVS